MIKSKKKELYQNEDFYRTIIETAHDLIWILDTKGDLTFYNRRCEETCGYGLSEWIGSNFAEFIHPEDLPKVQEVFLKTLQGNPLNYEVRAYDRNKKMFVLSVNTAPIYENSRIIGTASFGRDITERKNMEDSLRESEERYRRLVDYSPFGISIHDGDKLIYMNQAGAKILGAANPEEIIGKSIFQFIHPNFHEIIKNRISMVKEGRVAQLMEEKFLRLDGTPVDVEIVSIPFTYNGELMMYGVIKDITERQQAEETLRESEARYRSLVESARDIIFTVSSDSRITSLNPAFETVTGWSCAQWIGKDFQPLVHPHDLSSAIEMHRRFLNGDAHVSNFEVRILCKSMDYITMEITSTPQFRNGEIVNVLGIARDITERKRLEEIRLENERLLLASKAKSELFDTISHELRTPLTLILGFSEILKDANIAGELNEKQQRFVDKVVANSNHLLLLIDDILDLSKIEAGKLEPYIEIFPVSEIINEVVNLINEIAAKHSIIIKKELETFDLEADKRRFKQILLNLLSNAIKFSKPDGGMVTVTAKKSDGMAHISVSDTGIGIRKQDIGRLFWAFEQLESGIARKYGGTGLGLAISKRLVELHGGTLEVKSSFGEGSTFTFLLPLRANKNGN